MNKSNWPSFHITTALFAACVVAIFASGPVRAEIHCANGHCHCSGDDDCNKMFTDLCTDSGGSCDNGDNTCVCTQKLKATSGTSGGTKHLPQAGAALKNNNNMMKKY